MMEHFDVLIVGGGLVGSAAAYYLMKQGFAGTVALVEKDTTYRFSSTARSVGGIRQQFSTPENIELSRFCLRLIRNLREDFGPEADVGFREQGYLILASAEGLPILAENQRIQLAHGADNIILKGADLAARFPWLVCDGVGGGCFGVSGEGWLDPYSLMTLFRNAAVRQGVELISGEVSEIRIEASQVIGVRLVDGTTLGCGNLVSASGTGAGKFAALAGIPLPVVPRKRYVYVVDSPAADDALHQAPLTVDPSGVYFRPEGRHFICGLSPQEHEEPPVIDWDVDYVWFNERVWPILAARVRGFESVKVINAWVGHYDYNVLDHNAVIGRHPGIDNFYFANGFSGHGMQQGPAAGNGIAELIVHGAYRAIDLSRFGYQRIIQNTPLYEQNVI